MEKEMENLKSVDLMLGDYVICHRPTKPQEIVNVTAELLSVIERQEKGIINNIKSPMYRVVKPIPITKEILEINGFVEKTNRIKKLVWVRYYNDTLIEFIEETPNVYRITIHVMDSDLSDRIMYVQYIHELQNALRLCKIEKEIVL